MPRRKVGGRRPRPVSAPFSELRCGFWAFYETKRGSLNDGFVDKKSLMSKEALFSLISITSEGGWVGRNVFAGFT